MRSFVHILVAIALLTALISPACKFISGGMIEICAADGSLKTIFVPEDQIPPDVPGQNDNHHKKDTDCGFCFAQTHMKPLQAPADILIYLLVLAFSVFLVWRSTSYKRFELSALSLRGPPHLL